MRDRAANPADREKQFYFNCSYLPPELFAAVDLKACRPWLQEIDLPGGDLLPSDFCPYSRAFLEVSGPGVVLPVLADCCDAMRRVYDHLIPDSFLVEIPRITDIAGVDYFYQQLVGLLERLGVDYQADCFRERLWKEIGRYNSWRDSLRELREKLLQDQMPFSRLLEGINLYNQGEGERLTGLMKEIRPGEDNEVMPRVLLISSTLLERGLIELIEDLGLKIVGLDSCPGERSFNTGPVEEESGNDPLRALAKNYLTGHSCPRMMEIEGRLSYIEELFTGREPDGIIYFLPKFCDQAAYDFILIKEQAARRGLPVLQFEGEYHNSRGGQLKTRIAAFRESLIYWGGRKIDREGSVKQEGPER